MPPCSCSIPAGWNDRRGSSCPHTCADVCGCCPSPCRSCPRWARIPHGTPRNRGRGACRSPYSTCCTTRGLPARCAWRSSTTGCGPTSWCYRYRRSVRSSYSVRWPRTDRGQAGSQPCRRWPSSRASAWRCASCLASSSNLKTAGRRHQRQSSPYPARR